MPDPTREQKLKWLSDARQLLRAGMSREEVNRRLADVTGYGSTSDLAFDISSEGVDSDFVTSDIEAFGEVAADELAFGGADEAAGVLATAREQPSVALRMLLNTIGGQPASVGLTPEELGEAADVFNPAVERARERQESARERLTGLGEVAAVGAGLAPHLLVGGGVGRKFIQGAGGRLAAAGRGTGVFTGLGAAEGGLQGHLRAEEGERARGAATGAAVGGATGLALGGTLGLAGAASRAVKGATQSLFPNVEKMTRAGVEAVRRQTGLTSRVAREGLESLEELVPGGRHVIADLDEDLAHLARRAVQFAPETRGPGQVARSIIDRPAGRFQEAIDLAKTKVKEFEEIVEANAGRPAGQAAEVGLESARRSLRAVQQVARTARQTSNRIRAGRPSGLPGIKREGGILGLKGEIVDTFRASSEVNIEYARQMAEILLGPDGPRILEKYTPSFWRRVTGDMITATLSSTPSAAATVGGIAGQRGMEPVEPQPSLFQP